MQERRRLDIVILTENHKIKRSKHKELFKKIDAYCYRAKSLSNSVQYLICQCYRIHQKLKNGETWIKTDDAARFTQAVAFSVSLSSA